MGTGDLHIQIVVVYEGPGTLDSAGLKVILKGPDMGVSKDPAVEIGR